MKGPCDSLLCSSLEVSCQRREPRGAAGDPGPSGDPALTWARPETEATGTRAPALGIHVGRDGVEGPVCGGGGQQLLIEIDVFGAPATEHSSVGSGLCAGGEHTI